MNTLIRELSTFFTCLISETNGINLEDTLELALRSEEAKSKPHLHKCLSEFYKLLSSYQNNEIEISTLLNHSVSKALFQFFKNFPLPYKEEHIHLTGSLTADFIYPRLKKLLEGPHRELYMNKIKNVYGEDVKINSVLDVEELITLKPGEKFERYLKVLLLPKLILNSKEAHKEAAFHMASTLYHLYNVGHIRLKFTFSRASNNPEDQIPGLEQIAEEEVVLGLYEGFNQFKSKVPNFDFILSPSFRKEEDFFDGSKFQTKKQAIDYQVKKIVKLLENYPELKSHLCNIDTVGNEKNLFRKRHFLEMQSGFRKLQYMGFRIRSHHGETWQTLNKGVQAVDNAMNIWHINTLEHGLSLGINPNYYFHNLYQRILKLNDKGIALEGDSNEFNEIKEMDFKEDEIIREKLINGVPLNPKEKISFTKAKFHKAREVEHYQHDVLNRMLSKKVSLIALPTSNRRLTNSFPDFKDHPFSWWEKKGVHLGIGTDNYITLDTNYIQELLILLYTDARNLKLTKLLMVATGETRRPYLAKLMWDMRKPNA